MTNGHNRRAYELFQMVLERAPDQRAALLDEMCGTDSALRVEVEALLTADAEKGNYLETPAQAFAAVFDGTVAADTLPAPAKVPREIGQYHIKRVIASGGMGTVYEAVQQQPRRTVALKLLKHGIASRSASACEN